MRPRSFTWPDVTIGMGSGCWSQPPVSGFSHGRPAWSVVALGLSNRGEVLSDEHLAVHRPKTPVVPAVHDEGPNWLDGTGFGLRAGFCVRAGGDVG